MVNKDRSAALGMIRIFTNLLAHGSRPSIYLPIQNKIILKGNKLDKPLHEKRSSNGKSILK